MYSDYISPVDETVERDTMMKVKNLLQLN